MGHSSPISRRPEVHRGGRTRTFCAAARRLIVVSRSGRRRTIARILTATVAHSEIHVSDRHKRRKQFSNRNKIALPYKYSFRRGFRDRQRRNRPFLCGRSGRRPGRHQFSAGLRKAALAGGPLLVEALVLAAIVFAEGDIVGDAIDDFFLQAVPELTNRAGRFSRILLHGNFLQRGLRCERAYAPMAKIARNSFSRRRAETTGERQGWPALQRQPRRQIHAQPRTVLARGVFSALCSSVSMAQNEIEVSQFNNEPGGPNQPAGCPAAHAIRAVGVFGPLYSEFSG